jgi:CheY-like chemotaxis protein
VEALLFEGYEVRAATDGAAALATIEGWVPHVIVLDLMMPVMDGWAFREAQRQRASVRDVPVVILSASRDLGRAAEALRPAAVLAKPFDVDALLTAVDRCAARSAID